MAVGCTPVPAPTLRVCVPVHGRSANRRAVVVIGVEWFNNRAMPQGLWQERRESEYGGRDD